MNYPDNIGGSSGDPASPLYDGRHERGLGAVREEAREAWARDIQPTVNGLCDAMRRESLNGTARDIIHDAALEWLGERGFSPVSPDAPEAAHDAWWETMVELRANAKEAFAAAYAEGSE